jgi:endonuclease-3
MEILEEAALNWETPAVTIVSQVSGDPFKVLVSCLLSLRTLDRTTGPAAARLFALADCPEKMAELTVEEIAAAIYPVGFYRNKARQILEISRLLLLKHDGIVPNGMEELLAFNGVGRKTANLVLTLGFHKPGICVDTHVHRICNRWGYLATRSPDETEMVLRATLSPCYWQRINDLLVAFGQNLCRPVSPHCSLCPVYRFCDRRGVGKYR